MPVRRLRTVGITRDDAIDFARQRYGLSDSDEIELKPIGKSSPFTIFECIVRSPPKADKRRAGKGGK